MKVPKDNKEREARISKELKFIEEMYNLAFTIKDKAANKIKGFKQCFKFVADEKILLSIAKKLAEQVKELEALSKQFPKETVYYFTADRLKQIYIQIITLIKKEFKSIRNRNDISPRV